ncbi:LacI family transcriptional regulator [Microbacterium protaetiae]|uniref:LacI family transcriptional regulator n=2 Tax=Microbacterium protaetiae TaxID=2509458 RepID=A0A4P6EIF6_9MICO|nr:LacI family transcriptional regulator [Microbacterium protaetiae]
MADTPASRATLRDVARESHVSPATVSFVLNETPGQSISPETSQRVREAARRLGYRPHHIARALREGASRTVLLSTAGLPSGRSLDSFISGLEDELRSYDHALLVAHGREGGSIHPEVIDAFAPRAILDLGVVYTGDDAGWEGGWIDGLAAHVFAQLHYLADRGHREIAIAMPTTGVTARFASLRLDHAREAARTLGLRPPVEVDVGDDRDDAGAALTAMRMRHPSVSAIAAFDDNTALIALSALAELRVDVPSEIAVIGFDDDRYGALWHPCLTTVHIDAEAYGRRAARVALGRDPGTTQPAPTQIIRRDSA